MKPDRSIDSIIWGKKYSLKDRTPQVVVALFLVFILGCAIFSVILNDESNQSSEGEVEKSP